jgi:hypothetical protein
MSRRRRQPREIVFGFDSFLDVVANVCGIIIRLILVVWVGASAYHSIQEQARPPEPLPATVTEAEPEDRDPLEDDLAAVRWQLAEAEAALLHYLREVDGAQRARERVQQELTAVLTERQALLRQQTVIDQERDKAERAGAGTALSRDELRQRCQRLQEEIEQLRRQPPQRRALRYRTPVSKPVDAEELMFECRNGRVAFIDVAALLEEVKRGLREKSELLRTRWEVKDTAGPAGAFQLRYTVERERDALDIGGIVPDAHATFRYGVSRWEIEPILATRGEPLDAALKPGSEFRQIVDHLDGQHAAVTFWVYPDSFSLYRQLRDYLYERDLVVAGRPLPDGVAISSSRHGTVSRGQ